MQAWAAETAGTPGASFWSTPEFWVAVAFVILVAVAGRAVLRLVTTGLDARADAIRARVNEAEKLREEAQELLASYQRKQREATEETGRLLEQARQEAATLSAQAAHNLEQSVKRREQLAMERIAQAETAATREIRDAAVDVALEATRRVLAEKLSDTKADALIDEAIQGLHGKLH